MFWSWPWALLSEGHFLGLPGPVPSSCGARGHIVTACCPARSSGEGPAQESWGHEKPRMHIGTPGTPLSSGNGLLWRLRYHGAFTRWKQCALHVWFLHFLLNCPWCRISAPSSFAIKSGSGSWVICSAGELGMSSGVAEALGRGQGQVEPMCLAREAYRSVTPWGKGRGRMKGRASSESGGWCGGGGVGEVAGRHSDWQGWNLQDWRTAWLTGHSQDIFQKYFLKCFLKLQVFFYWFKQTNDKKIFLKSVRKIKHIIHYMWCANGII